MRNVLHEAVIFLFPPAVLLGVAATLGTVDLLLTVLRKLRRKPGKSYLGEL